MAPPEIAIINKAEAVLVNFPRPSKVKGQTAGQTKALAIPNADTNTTEVNPVVFRIQIVKIIPKNKFLKIPMRACLATPCLQ